MTRVVPVLVFLAAAAPAASAQTTVRLVPADGSSVAIGQRFDVRAEAASSPGQAPPAGLQVTLDGRPLAGVVPRGVPAHAAALVARDVTLDAPGRHVLVARTADGAEARVTVEAYAWQGSGPRARNVILLLGDGMGAAHRTAARIVSKGVREGRAQGRLAMDTLDVTGLVMTSSLNAVVTDSAPGMSAYVTGHKSSNNQEGVYPDNTPGDAFDNPRVEYLGSMLRRLRGPGFRTGLVTTASVTDATPAANAIHTANRDAGDEIAARYLDERDRHGVAVLLGGGAAAFHPKGAVPGGAAADGRADGRDLAGGFRAAGYATIGTATELAALARAAAPPPAVLGLFHPRHMTVAFDKVGAGRYSDELARPGREALRDQPMLEDMTALALRVLERHAPDGFYLMVEGASIDKRAHAADPERMLWDVIEFDRAVAVALEFARRTNGDSDPDNDTLVIVTADHECGGLGIIGVGNERYAPAAIGRAVRDYAATLRFDPTAQVLDLETNYEVDARGYPVDPDPTRKLLLGWAAAPDRFENWQSNRQMHEAAVHAAVDAAGQARATAVANPLRDGPGPDADNATTSGVRIPGFLVAGVIENGATGCPDTCPADTAAAPHTIAGHTASDVPLGAAGPGAWQFTGVYENTDVFRKILHAAGGTVPAR